MRTTIIDWTCRIIAAVILGQTLFFKFTAAEESVEIFSALGAEPWGRIASGVIEAIAVILLLIPRTAWLGAALAGGVVLGAIASHLTVLGIVVADDGGLLFALACITAACSATSLAIHRHELPLIGHDRGKAPGG